MVAVTQLLNESSRYRGVANQNEATEDNIVMRLESLLGILEELISNNDPLTDNHSILLSL